MRFYYFSLILSNCLLVIAFLYGIISKRSVLTKEWKWYLYYLGFIFCVELTVEFLVSVIGIPDTSYTYPFYIGGEFFLLSSIFIVGLGLSRKWYLIIGVISLLLFGEAAFLWFDNQSFTAGIGKVFSHLSIACMSGYFLIKGLKNFEKQNNFLIIYACLFLYYSVSLFLFLLLDQLPDMSNNQAAIIWGMNNILSAILYATSFYTFFKLKK